MPFASFYRVASADVSKSLELCEDELKDLGAALEELTEAFDEAARLTQLQLDINNSGCVSRMSHLIPHCSQSSHVARIA